MRGVILKKVGDINKRLINDYGTLDRIRYSAKRVVECLENI